ncbi:MAG TPA: HsdR family type I site-specific deoxyribonuclease [bacterium]|nr:HsdR family type I site-specific deoxyribonuclease [bacterium]HPP30166.1 HsdR family type I site-specific deoxyribonuclease [bacterium]
MEKYEKKLVEDYIGEKLEEIGWKFVVAGELKRESTREPLLFENLKEAITRINRDKNIGDEEIKKVMDEIKLLQNEQEGIKKFLHYLKYGIGIKFEKERVVKIVDLIDYENPDNNEFIFSKQVHFRGSDLIIPDIVLYVNGIPLVEIECKSPVDIRTDWQSGYNQIKNYEKIVPELYKYVQIGISLCEKVRYFPIVPWTEKGDVYIWKKDKLPEDEAIIDFLTPCTLLDILRNFLFIREQYGEIKKVICRYMQYNAVNKIYNRVIGNIKGTEDKNKGLIWHWQGSGKTLTMIFASHKLYFDKHLENPSIFIIVDRKELEEQMKEELSSLKLNFSFELVENVRGLKEIITYDNFRGKRGVFLTLIHKFSPDEKFLPEEIPNSISERKNVICFLDEVHRSQYGLLAACMKSVLKNAFYFGFTGTPISERERNTYMEFGYPLKEEGYLDRYFLDQSQRDGFTVPLIYQLRLENLHINEKDIKFFIEKIEEDEFKGDVDFYPDVSERVRKRLNYINVILESENRIEKISKDIAEHFKENIDGKFKGMVVCGSRKAAVLYKKYLDLYLPPEYSEVVMTFGLGDKEPIKSFYSLWKMRHPEFPDDDRKIKKIVEDFKEKEFPKIIIVTDMLITGFDAPILQVIYLDKLLKKHRLLQTIARTNRPYNDMKEAGLIIDYAGVIKHLNYALREYYRGDVKGLLFDFNSLFEEFEGLIENMRGMFKGIGLKIERENLLEGVEILKDDRIREEFFSEYKKARKIFELLTSHSQKLKYLKEFKWFTAVYEYYKKLTMDEEEEKYIERFFKKTLDIVHKSFEVEEIKNVQAISKIDLKNIEKLKKSLLPEKERVINIIFALSKLVLVEKLKSPAYKSIAERVENLIRQWKERKFDTELLFEEEKGIIREIERVEIEKENLGFDDFDYGIFSILKDDIKEKERMKIKEYVEEIRKLIKEDMIENWMENPALKQNIERKTREFCLKLKNAYGLSYETFDLLHKKLTDFIKEYAG